MTSGVLINFIVAMSLVLLTTIAIIGIALGIIYFIDGGFDNIKPPSRDGR